MVMLATGGARAPPVVGDATRSNQAQLHRAARDATVRSATVLQAQQAAYMSHINQVAAATYAEALKLQDAAKYHEALKLQDLMTPPVSPFRGSAPAAPYLFSSPHPMTPSTMGLPSPLSCLGLPSFPPTPTSPTNVDLVTRVHQTVNVADLERDIVGPAPGLGEADAKGPPGLAPPPGLAAAGFATPARVRTPLGSSPSSPEATEKSFAMVMGALESPLATTPTSVAHLANAFGMQTPTKHSRNETRGNGKRGTRGRGKTTNFNE